MVPVRLRSSRQEYLLHLAKMASGSGKPNFNEKYSDSSFWTQWCGVRRSPAAIEGLNRARAATAALYQPGSMKRETAGREFFITPTALSAIHGVEVKFPFLEPSRIALGR
jgi:hypothetical protein